jgi:YVTN family beta-propeller protein
MSSTAWASKIGGHSRLRPTGSGFRRPRRLIAVTTVLALGTGPGLFAGATAGATVRPVVTASIPVATSSMAVDPSIHTLYATSGPSLVAIDEITRKVTATISGFGASPGYVAVDPSTHDIYVSDGTAVTVIDGAAGADHDRIIATVPVGDNVFEAAVDPTTHDVYVIDENAAVSVIDTTAEAGNDKVVATIPVGYGPAALAVDPFTHDVYVVSEDVNTVSIIDGSDDARNDTVIATNYDVGNQPDAVAVDPVTHAVYVANQSSQSVSVIDGADNKQKFKVIATVAVPGSPDAVAVDPSTHAVYVASRDFPAAVALIDGRSGSDAYLTATTIPYSATQIPTDVAVDPSTHTLYVAVLNTNNNAGEVAVISASADVALTVTGPSAAADRSKFTEHVTVTNRGPDFAPSVATDLSIPAGLRVTSAPGATGPRSTTGLKWTDRALAPGATVTHLVTLSVAAHVRATVALGGVAVDSAPDPDPANNAAIATIRLG